MTDATVLTCPGSAPAAWSGWSGWCRPFLRRASTCTEHTLSVDIHEDIGFNDLVPR